MRVVIVGAGSQSTPHLFLAPEIVGAAEQLDITLVGRHDHKTRAIATAVRALNDAYRIHTANIEDDLSEAFAGADVIVIQARYGDYAGRLHDETFPLRFGVPGDEGLGPGGLANAWRSWPHLALLLARIERASPRATILCLTAPLSILTRCASIVYPSLRWYGLCELPWVTLKKAALAAGVDPGAVSFDYAGVNHLGWFDRVECDGVDVIGVLAASTAKKDFPSAETIARLSALPLKYLELHYRQSAVLERQRRRTPRSDALREYADRAICGYASGEPKRIFQALELRKAPWYYDAVAPFLAFLRGCAVEVPFFLSVRNQGYLPNVGDDEVVEVPHLVRDGTLARSPRTQPLSRELAGTLDEFVEFERRSAVALIDRDESAIESALAAHPWIQSGVRELAREVGATAGYVGTR